MKRLEKSHRIYAMSAANPPALEVAPGETFCLEVEDCYSGNLKTPEDTFSKAMWDTVNPATGPVAVRGSRPGDLLRIEILDVRTRDFAVMCLEHGAGAMGGCIEGVETTIMPIRDGRLIIGDGLSAPINPMIGVIGTAPAGESVLNGTPGEHGGNMDCKLITAGATLYLPVNVPGALLGAGDLHARMGDGEVAICGAETAGEVVLRAAPVHDAIPTPFLETANHWHAIASALTLDECESAVLRKMHRFLTRREGMSANQAVRLMSLFGDLAVCQVVDPLKTMRFSMPKRYTTNK